MLQASEAVEYHEHFETLFERYEQWMKDAESRLAKHSEMKSDYDIEEHYRSVEVRTSSFTSSALSRVYFLGFNQ